MGDADSLHWTYKDAYTVMNLSVCCPKSTV